MNKQKEVNDKFLEISNKLDIVKDLYCLTLYEQTILLTYHVFGLILVNGLYNTLQDELDDDPKYIKTLAAFERIGSSDVSLIIKKCQKIINYESEHKKLSISKAKKIHELEDLFLSCDNKFIFNIYNFMTHKNRSI